QITQKAHNIIPYNKNNIIPINWHEYNTNIQKEFLGKEEKLKSNQVSIHDALKEYLLRKDSDYDFILYDHGTGEMADYITLKENNNFIEIQLIHVKSASSLSSKNNNVGDVYELAGQCIKSINWIKSKTILEKKVKDMNRKHYCEIIYGD